MNNCECDGNNCLCFNNNCACPPPPPTSIDPNSDGEQSIGLLVPAF